MLIDTERLRKMLSAVSMKLLRKLPIIPFLEYRMYRVIEKQLSLADRYDVTSFIPPYALDKYRIRKVLSKSSDYRVVYLNDLTDDDRDFISKNGLSIEYISANNLPFSRGGITDKPAYQEKDGIDRAFQLESIKSHDIKAICPKSGKLLRSNRSLLANAGHAIFYRFTGCDYVFYLVVGRDGMGYVKLYIYLPEIQTVITLGHKAWAWLGRWEIDIFRAFAISNHGKISSYLANKTAPAMCVLVDHPHFAHHICNTLTGLRKIATKQSTELIDRILITEEPMGPIDQLFPEFGKQKVQRIESSVVCDVVLTENLFLIRPGGIILKNDVARRIYRVAVNNVTLNYVRDAKEFRAKHWPILWATIRTGNRTWASQAEGIVNIANELQTIYPDFALIVDGYAIPNDKQNLDRKVRTIIEDEERVIRKLRELLGPTITLHAFIGMPMFESVIYSRCIDFYLAHHGSLQHKIAWLSNKPGVVHSNKETLSNIDKIKPWYPAFSSISTSVLPVYLDADMVTDIPGAIRSSKLRWNPSLDNYEFDYRHAINELRNILGYLEKPASVRK